MKHDPWYRIIYRGNARQTRLGKETGWFRSRTLVWFRICGYGAYRVRGDRPYLLLPGRPPQRNRGTK